MSEISHNIFKEINSEESAYLFGFFLGDGYFCWKHHGIGFGLSVKDIDHLYKIKSILGGPRKISISHIKMANYTIISREATKDLLNLGVKHPKSHQDWIKDITLPPKEIMSHFMRGYFDADGGFSIQESRAKVKINGKRNCVAYYAFGQYCKETSLFFLNFFKDINIEFNYNVKPLVVFELQLSKNKVKSLIEYLYKDASIFLLRKKLLSEEILNNVLQ